LDLRTDCVHHRLLTRQALEFFIQGVAISATPGAIAGMSGGLEIYLKTLQLWKRLESCRGPMSSVWIADRSRGYGRAEQTDQSVMGICHLDAAEVRKVRVRHGICEAQDLLSLLQEVHG
jgi:hypothetical protein